MTLEENSLSGRMPASRRSFVKGLGAAGTVLPALAVLPRWSFAEDAAAIYANAAIDWKQFSGQTITLAGAIHPWSNAITPLLPEFTKLTGINVATDFQLETRFLGALADQARPREQHARRLHVPDLWPRHLGRMARAAERLLFRQVADRCRLVRRERPPQDRPRLSSM